MSLGVTASCNSPSAKSRKSILTNNLDLVFNEILFKRYDVIPYLNKTVCPRHAKKKNWGYCKFVYDKHGTLKEKYSKSPNEATIYTQWEKWKSTNYLFWCSAVRSIEYKILNIPESFVFGDGDRIEVNGQQLFCVAPKAGYFITMEVIIYCNDLVFNSNQAATICMLYVHVNEYIYIYI